MATMWTGDIDNDLSNNANYDSAVASGDNIEFLSTNLTGVKASPQMGICAVTTGTCTNTDLGITGGTFNCPFVNGASGTISDTEFNGTVENHGTINSGTFNSTVENVNGGFLTGGTYNGVVSN